MSLRLNIAEIFNLKCNHLNAELFNIVSLKLVNLNKEQKMNLWVLELKVSIYLI